MIRGLLSKVAGPARRAPTRALGPIALQFGLHRWRMMQVSVYASKPSLRAFSCLAYPESRDAFLSDKGRLKHQVRKVLNKEGFRRAPVVSCLAPDQVRIAMLHYTVQPRQAEDGVVLERMGSRLDGDIADYVLDYVPIRNDVTDSQERAALVAAARQVEVIDYLDLLRYLGFSIGALEIGPTAVRRLVTSWQAHIDDNVLVVTMGQDATYMTVLSGRRLIFEREAPFGERLLVERLCHELELTETEAHLLLDRHGLRMDDKRLAGARIALDAEGAGTVFEVLKPLFMALVEDLNKALIYTASATRGRPVAQVYLNGAVARWKGVPALLSQMVSVPVAVLDPLRGLVDDGSESTADPRAAIVAGMALRGMVGDA